MFTVGNMLSSVPANQDTIIIVAVVLSTISLALMFCIGYFCGHKHVMKKFAEKIRQRLTKSTETQQELHD